ncbi:MAG TPA: hypothetical protein PLD88_01500, partial [Candidatus Berkiella sp.]|nr:hypothetical protein [Candidatus Berkiella sp.]
GHFSDSGVKLLTYTNRCGGKMSRISLWVGNVTFWFQTKRNQQKDMSNQNNGNDSSTANPLTRSILDIMKEPKDPQPKAPPPSKHKP